jgi:Kef-type K+ transport system membrane component KefB
MSLEILKGTLDALSRVLDANGPPAAATAASFTPTDFSVHFFLQLAIILVTCRVVGKLGQMYLGQPQVVGEMIAGVLLGPSLFGLLFPAAQAAVFPGPTKNVLYSGAQLGVGLYMFMVGGRVRAVN